MTSSSSKQFYFCHGHLSSRPIGSAERTAFARFIFYLRNLCVNLVIVIEIVKYNDCLIICLGGGYLLFGTTDKTILLAPTVGKDVLGFQQMKASSALTVDRYRAMVEYDGAD